MIYIVGIEPINTRYTGHWAQYVPAQIESATEKPVKQIMGEILEAKLTEGAFFNFNSTIYFKNTQNNEIVKLFNEGQVEEGDYFLVMDAWNATAHQIRYMADLNGINIKMGGIWHAGSYDENDFLGRQFKDKTWSYSLERSMYNLYDHNFFATEYHKKLFNDVLGCDGKSFRTGFPMEYYANISDEVYFDTNEKENLVIFPHRISEEKRPDLFKEIRDICATRYPNIEFVICQEEGLSKSKYHELLRKAKVVFSANKQETLGIGVYEGLLCGAVPMALNDLSYTEMYSPQFLYDKELVNDPLALADMIAGTIASYYTNITDINHDMKYVTENYFTGTRLYEILKNDV